MNGQHCKNYDVKRETVHCYPRNVDRCCTWSERAVEGGLMLSLESQRVFQNLVLLLFCYTTNNLMAGPLANSEFCFPRISMFPSTSSRESQCLTLRFERNVNSGEGWYVSKLSRVYYLGRHLTHTFRQYGALNVVWSYNSSRCIHQVDTQSNWAERDKISVWVNMRLFV